MYTDTMINKPDSSPTRWWDLPATLLLFVAIYLAALRLSATKWTEELAIIQVIAILGLIAGLALGQSAFSRRTVRWFAVIYGLSVIGWRLGLTLGRNVLWNERILSLWGRLGVSLRLLLQRKAVSDPLLFVLIMAVLYWALSLYAGYSLTREANSWKSTLPMGLALFIIHIHDPYWTSRSWFLAGYIFLALILLSRVTFLKKQAAWEQNHTHMPPYVGIDFLRATLVAVIVIIVMAWSTPAFAATVPPMQQAWQTVSRPIMEARARVSNAFASLRSSVGIVNEYYGTTLSLGRGNVLDNTIVLTVQAPERPTAGIRYYWRARTYDQYSEGGWLGTRRQSEIIFPEDGHIFDPPEIGRWEASFRFTPYVPLITLYSAPQPKWISRPVNAEVTFNADGSVDLAALQATVTLQPGETYEVQSSLTDVTIAQLRASGTDYPAWIVERYLQTPASLTPRMLALAQEIATDLDNPYDIANAVTQYMRDNIQYSDTIPTPPADQEPLDWILFDLKQGFCNYYASAEIMMLRSLGIPARLAVGYAQGQHDEENNVYTVLQRDAHAWPEVYFPEIGWVEFEPTLNQRPIRRPAGESTDEDPAGGGGLDGASGSSSDLDREALLGAESLEDDPLLEDGALLPEEPAGLPLWALIAIPGLILVAVVGLTWYRYQYLTDREPSASAMPISVKLEARLRRFGIKPPKFLRKWAYQASLPSQARAYQEINRALNRMGNTPAAHKTPAERANMLARLLPTAAHHTQTLLTEYQALAYSPTPGDPFIARQAARAIRNAAWAAIGQRFIARFQEPAQRKTLV